MVPLQHVDLYATDYHLVKRSHLHAGVSAGLRARDEVTWGSTQGICVYVFELKGFECLDGAQWPLHQSLAIMSFLWKSAKTLNPKPLNPKPLDCMIRAGGDVSLAIACMYYGTKGM